MFVLVPILSPESQATMAPLLIESQGQVKQTTEQLHIAKLSLDRAENLVKTRSASEAALDRRQRSTTWPRPTSARPKPGR